MNQAIQPKITHQLNAEGIYIVNFFGQITFEAVMEFIAELKVLEGLPDEFLVLYDLSKASFELTQSELKEISEKAIDATDKYNSIRAAFVVDEPKATAYSIMFSYLNSSPKTTREIFSTITVAKNWLMSMRY